MKLSSRSNKVFGIQGEMKLKSVFLVGKSRVENQTNIRKCENPRI